jgi:hypothetical protein
MDAKLAIESNRAASKLRVADNDNVVEQKCARSNLKHLNSSACVSYLTLVLAQKHDVLRLGWFSGNGAGNTEQNRCTNSDALSANVFGSTSAWFARSTQTCTAFRIAPEASSTVATESGTLVISTGRIIGGGCDSPAKDSMNASPPSVSIARRPKRGDAHAATGHRVSGIC